MTASVPVIIKWLGYKTMVYNDYLGSVYLRCSSCDARRRTTRARAACSHYKYHCALALLVDGSIFETVDNAKHI